MIAAPQHLVCERHHFPPRSDERPASRQGALCAARVVHVLEKVTVRGNPAEAADRNGERQLDQAAIAQIDDAVLESLNAIDARLVPPELGRRSSVRRHPWEPESPGRRHAGAGRLCPHHVSNRGLPVEGGPWSRLGRFRWRNRLYRDVLHHQSRHAGLAWSIRSREHSMGAGPGSESARSWAVSCRPRAGKGAAAAAAGRAPLAAPGPSRRRVRARNDDANRSLLVRSPDEPKLSVGRVLWVTVPQFP